MHPIPWHHGTAGRELMWFVRNVNKILHVADTMVDIELGDRDRGTAAGIVLRHQTERSGPDSPKFPTQYTAVEVPWCWGTLFPKPGHHIQALLSCDHTSTCQV